MNRSAVLVLLIAGVILAGCEGTESAVQERAERSSSLVTEISSPSSPGAGEPFLTAGADGSLLMSWLEPAGDSHALRFARYEDGEWSAPVTIEERSDFFVNWADFPSIVEPSDGTMMAHWLQKSGDAPYAYDVKIAISTDRGRTWGESSTLHDDGVVSEHGFVTLVPDGDAVAAAWLDGRKMTGGGHGDGAGSMTLRFARIHPDGTVTDRAELDDRVCECCQTSMAMSGGQFVVVYRNRSEEEVRDIGVVRGQSEEWSEPGLIHGDGWKIAACPVNGPQIDSVGETMVVAWYTEGAGNGQVFAAFSSDRGETFGEPLRLDEGSAIGRVDTIVLDDGTAFVVWMKQSDGNGEVVARSVSSDGDISKLHPIGRSESSRSAGFPRMTKVGDRVYVAWTEPGEPARIHVVEIDPEEIS